MNCDARKHRLFYCLFSSYIRSFAKYMLQVNASQDQTNMCVRFPSPSLPSSRKEMWSLFCIIIMSVAF